MKSDIKGICPIITTPFKESGEVDYQALERVINWMVSNGCHGVTLFGIAGEYYKLTDEERRHMVDLTVRVCRQNSCPSIISVTDHATEIAIQTAKEWEARGADCLMLLPPFFLKPPASALYDHMVKVAAAVSIPVMVQYAPEQTGVTMNPEVLASIGTEVETEVIYKIENRPPGPMISKVLAIAGGDTKIFIGNAGFQFIEGLDRGGVGAMPGCSMFDLYLQIYDHWKEGDRATALRIHSALLSMLNHIRQNVEQIIHFEKRILVRRNVLTSAKCRLPSFVSDEYYDRIFDDLYPVIESYFTVPGP